MTEKIGPKSDIPETVRLVNTLDDSTEVVSRHTAHDLRIETGLDLVMVSEKSDPPVVRLIDYGKHRFESQKREREKNRKTREANRSIKEVYFGVAIGEHDYQTKLNQIRKLLKKHDIRIGVKDNRSNRLSLPRGKRVRDVARMDDFILNRVIRDLSQETRMQHFNFGDRAVTAVLQPGSDN